MALQRNKEEFFVGEDVDFDQLNEQIRKTAVAIDTKEKLPNPSIDTRNLYGGPSSPLKQSSGARKRLEEPSLKETPAERLLRLKGELQELREEIQVVIERERQIKIANPETPASLLREIETIQNQITNIYQNEGLAKVIKTEGASNNEAEKDLLELKDSLKYHKAETLLNKLRDLQKGEGKADSIVYKINMKNVEEPAKQEKIEDIEGRITKLENILSNSGIQNLLEDFQKIKKRVEMVPGSNIDQITKKLNQVSEELETLNKKKQNLDLNDPRLIKAEKMYEAYLKLQRIAEHLPGIVRRLECIKAIHEESANISDKIQSIKDNETEIAKALEQGNELLNKVGETFDKHLSKIASDIKSLQERIEKGQKK